MKTIATELSSVVIIEFPPFTDERGVFRRIHCSEEFAAAGLPEHMVQSNLSLTHRKGSVRGMHFQKPPSREGKLVRCIRGGVYDVVVDMRKGSPEYLTHLAIELRSDVNQALYIPPGFAHGFQTLEDETEVLYMMSDFYSPELSTGVRWNDPIFEISWPLPVADISDKDLDYPDFDPETDFGFAGPDSN